MSVADIFVTGVNGDDMLVVFSAATAVMAFLAVWHGLVVRDPITARVRSLSNVRAGLKSKASAAKRNRARGDFRQSSLSFMRLAVLKLNLIRGRQMERITDKLNRAGWRSKDAVTIYIFAKAFLPVVLGGGALLFLGIRSQVPVHPTMTYGVLVFSGIAGLFGADLVVRNAGDKRVKKLTRAMPDALDLLVICAEAGLSLDSAIKRVGHEIAASSPEMSDELSLTAIELNFLPDRQQALQNLVRRTDMPKLRALVNTLLQSERFGTPLANSLRVLSFEFRDERMMKAEEKAAKLPAIMTVPMIMFILPSLFMIIMGPAVIHIIDSLKGS